MKTVRPFVATLLLLLACVLPIPVLAQVDGLPWGTSIRHEPSQPCPDSAYQLVIGGVFPTACARVVSAQVTGPASVEIRVQTPYPATGFCPADSVPWEHRFPMPGLAAGFTAIAVNMIVVDETAPSTPPDIYWAEHPVIVSDSCGQVPPPPSPFSLFSEILISAADALQAPNLPICPTDSIQVVARGAFPNDCYVLRRVDVLPSMSASPFPAPPILRFVFDDRACLDRLCLNEPVRWGHRVELPPLPTGRYFLGVVAAIVSCRDSILPGDPIEFREFSFRVVPPESCGTAPAACLWASWDHSGNVGGCDAVIDPVGGTSVTMNLMTGVALAGLEGLISVSPQGRGLAVGRIEPIGVAAGMRIQTTPTPEGMRFVMFATEGAPIPPNDVLSGLPILKVSLDLVPVPAIYPVPDRYLVMAGNLLGADANAGPVPVCPIRTLEGRTGLVAEAATVCARPSCDFNRDGHADVRDLVTMVRCLNGLPPCDVTRIPGVDCQGDGDFDLDDVVCCASSVLGGSGCPDCPSDSVRQAPGVSLAFGEPEATVTGLRVPLRVLGASELGGARFALDYPAAGYRVAAFETDRVPSDWLALHTAGDGRLEVALLGLGSGAPSATAPIEVALVLERIEGTNGAGEVRVSDAEFSGTDGVRLEVTGAEPAMPIGDPAALALSAASPNPFNASTSFRLTLGSRANVVVAVYDLAGRRVAELHDGVLPVGVHAFTWRGRHDDGRPAAGGVYFYRAETAGRVTARKMILLGSK